VNFVAIKYPRPKSRNKRDKPYWEDSGVLAALKERTSVAEMFVHFNSHAIHLYAFTEEPDVLKKQLQSHIEGHVDSSAKELVVAMDLNAVSSFLKESTLDSQLQTGGVASNLRMNFSHARQTGLTGSNFNKLYQRALWLSERVRIETRVRQHAMNPEAVVADLAGKIFGDLRNRHALIVSSRMGCKPYAEKLIQKAIGSLRFVDVAQHTTGSLSSTFSGDVVHKKDIGQAVKSTDILFVFDEESEQVLLESDWLAVIETRRHAPILVVSLAAVAGKWQADLSRMQNVYFYTKVDLQNVVDSNLKEQEKFSEQYDRLVETEAHSFIKWLHSNEPYRFGEIIAKSRNMQNIMELIARIAQTDISVLIDGESGTGKELIARSIHEHSSRVSKPFVVVNCGAIPESLLESELFGHIKGAFTGAFGDKKGLFEIANEGTVFLDEIGEISTATQVKLLRFLQEREIKPVGSNQTMHGDVRVIAATNKNLAREIERGRFRQDLYYRLNVIQITLPPLRERKDDILPMTEYFVQKYSEKMRKEITNLDSDAERSICLYDWPGNVRELENAIERGVALSGSSTLTRLDLPPILGKGTASQKIEKNENISLKEVERRHIINMLNSNDWNYDLVTSLLGIGRTTLWRKMKEYGITNKKDIDGI